MTTKHKPSPLFKVGDRIHHSDYVYALGTQYYYTITEVIWNEKSNEFHYKLRDVIGTATEKNLQGRIL